MSRDRQRRHVIIGHGPAGMSAAEAVRARQPDASIQLVSAERYPFYSRPGLAYYLANEIPEQQLFSRPMDHYRRFQFEVVHGRAARIEPDVQMILLADGRRLAYDTLLLATGSQAVLPDMPGIDLDGVVTLDNLPDTVHILAEIRRARRLGLRTGRAVVVGGGITALEMVEGFLARGLMTHYLMRRSHFWSNVFTTEESELITNRLNEEGVRIHPNSDLVRILGRARKGYRPRDQRWRGDTLPHRGCGSGRASTLFQLARDVGLRVDRGVLVDEQMRTSAPNVFAAGDIAQVVDRWSGEARLEVLWPTAIAMGAIAGANMAGAELKYRKNVPFNVARMAGLPVTIIGQIGTGRADLGMTTLGRGASEAWNPEPPWQTVISTGQAGHQRIVLRGNRLIGAVLIGDGDQTLAEPLRYLIEREIDITPIAGSSVRLRAEPDRDRAAFCRVDRAHCRWSGGRAMRRHRELYAAGLAILIATLVYAYFSRSGVPGSSSAPGHWLAWPVWH